MFRVSSQVWAEGQTGFGMPEQLGGLGLMTDVGIALTLLSGTCNGLFAVPIRLARQWKWENIWLVFVLTSCILVPAAVNSLTLIRYPQLLDSSPAGAVFAAVLFGFLWGFGAILFGLSLDRLGVSLANSLVLGLSGALGSLVPLILGRGFSFEARHFVLFVGILGFLGGVWLCGSKVGNKTLIIARGDQGAFTIHVGDTTRAVPWLVETGAEILELDAPIEFETAWQAVRGRACLLGNVDTSETSPARVEEECRWRMERVKPDSGFILSSGCAISPNAPRENLHAMVESSRKWGGY